MYINVTNADLQLKISIYSKISYFSRHSEMLTYPLITTFEKYTTPCPESRLWLKVRGACRFNNKNEFNMLSLKTFLS